ncbi:MAG TPA: VOC family protein [Thermoplasmata archaeon]|nr:VOC family protein [Thermoplasmata archaeon]
MPEIKYLYAGIRVRNLDRSLRFYRALGFKRAYGGTMYHGGKFVHLKCPGSRAAIELNWYPRGNEFYTPWRSGTEFDHFGFWVGDVDSTLKLIERSGGSVAVQLDREGTPSTRHVYARDPDGNWLEIMGKWPHNENKKKK